MIGEPGLVCLGAEPKKASVPSAHIQNWLCLLLVPALSSGGEAFQLSSKKLNSCLEWF